MSLRQTEEWRYRFIILDLGTRWRWVVSFTPRQLYPRGKSPPPVPIGDWVGSTAGLDTVEYRNLLPLPGIEALPTQAEENLTICLSSTSGRIIKQQSPTFIADQYQIGT
jgi:hypothetical protein